MVYTESPPERKATELDVLFILTTPDAFPTHPSPQQFSEFVMLFHLATVEATVAELVSFGSTQAFHPTLLCCLHDFVVRLGSETEADQRNVV